MISAPYKILGGIFISLMVGYVLRAIIDASFFVVLVAQPLLGLSVVAHPILLALPPLLLLVVSLLVNGLLYSVLRNQAPSVAKGIGWGMLLVAVYALVLSAFPLLAPEKNFQNTMQKSLQELNSRTEADCDSLPAHDESDKRAIAECYTRIATQTIDVSFCDKIPTNGSERASSQSLYFIDTCLMNLATKGNNPALCDRLTGGRANNGDIQSEKQLCRDFVRAQWPASSLQPTSNGASSAQNGASQSSGQNNSDRWQSFRSAYFTLSFDIPLGFEVRDQKNTIAIAKSPYYTRDTGDDNAFFRLTRYDQYHTRESQIALYRKLLKNLQESSTITDGASFLTFEGDDYGRFEGDSAGKVVVVFFEASWLEIIERPANSNQDFDPIGIGKKILSTFRFSRGA